jgi:holliday junction DNA helicase RuvA
MIARLKGTLEEKSEERVVVDVQGVGYGLFVPETVSRRLPEPGQSVTLQVHTHVRESDITLYGFLSALEREVFELLMTVSGVGPKAALAVLSSLEAIQVLEGVSRGDKALFAGISGVGKKTVEKIFVEIREKAEKRLLLERGEIRRSTTAKSVAGETPWAADLEGALLALGYRENDVKVVVRETLARAEAKDFDGALRYALQLISNGGARPKGVRGTA